MTNNSVCIIPARMGSSRFPGKPLASLLGMPMLGHVAKRCLLEPIFSEVVVATCDQEIADYCTSIQVKYEMTSDKHERASDRCQEALENFEKKNNKRFDALCLVQGDEPMVTPNMLRIAMEALKNSKAPCVNLRALIDSEEEFKSSNCVKVVCDLNGNALYFSREAIPSVSKYKQKMIPDAYKQVCVIPFTRDFIDTYSSLKPTRLEEIESVDMNRCLEHGYTIHCASIQESSYPVDVPNDLIKVEEALKKCQILRRYT